MNDSRKRLLLLSGGSLVGQNIVQALGSRKDKFRLIATNSMADEPSLQDFDEVHLLPPTADTTAFEQAVEKLIDAESPVLVVPCRDEDIVFLADFARRRSDLAVHCLCGDPGLARVMLDKFSSWEFSQRHGLPFVPTVLPENTNAMDAFIEIHGFPLLVKPSSGFASRGVSLIFKRAQLDAAIAAKGMIVQKYLGNPTEIDNFLDMQDRQGLPLFHTFETVKHSIQVMLDSMGSVAGLFTTLHRMRQGISVAVEEDTSSDAVELGSTCARVFAGAGWYGPLNIQCQRAPDGKLYIYEFNGRFTGATAARALMGFDEVGLALRYFSGIDVGILSGRSGARVARQGISRIVPEGLQADLEQAGVWRRNKIHK